MTEKEQQMTKGLKYPEAEIKELDFKRPRILTAIQRRQVTGIHETFARLLAIWLPYQLDLSVQVKLKSISEISYEDYIQTIGDPTTVAIIKLDPLSGFGAMELNPALSFAILDRLFGGNGESSDVVREHSDIELSVLEGIFVRILSNFRASWSTAIDIRPRLYNIESSPGFLEKSEFDPVNLFIQFEIQIGGVTGHLKLCLPRSLIVSLLSEPESKNLIPDKSDRTKGLVVHEFCSYNTTGFALDEIKALKIGDPLPVSNKEFNYSYITELGIGKGVSNEQ